MLVEAAIEAATVIFSWPTILFVILGTLLGMLFGALPGLGGIVVLALLIPLTIGMDATEAMALFGAALGGVAFGGSVSAILINVPGTAPNAATLLDGYPMTRNGQSGPAIGAAAAASAFGAIFGLVVLVLLIPVARAVVLAFAAPEFFMLTMFGIVVIAFVTRGGLIKGIVAGGFGLLFDFVGWDPLTGTVRFNIIEVARIGVADSYLYDGVKLVPAAIGLFALAEILFLSVTERETIADPEKYERSEGVLEGVMAVVKRPVLVIRSSTIGMLVGTVPGVGGTIATFISYLAAVQASSDPDRFGTGEISGVIASEAANDAKDGGALLPTLTFGIPGSATTALILGALILHGIAPGPQLLTDQLPVVFAIVIALLVSNVLTSSIGILVADHLTKITTISTSYLIPLIVVVSFWGAFTVNNSFGDVVMAVFLGILAFFMLLYDYSRIALIIGLILGTTAETRFDQSINAYDQGFLIFFTRPISLVLFLGLILMITYPMLKRAVATRL
jgi:putative tricarboxylic transport membrane protein